MNSLTCDFAQVSLEQSKLSFTRNGASDASRDNESAMMLLKENENQQSKEDEEYQKLLKEKKRLLCLLKMEEEKTRKNRSDFFHLDLDMKAATKLLNITE